MEDVVVEFGREEPRIYTPPLRELTPETSAGFSVIQFAEECLGFTLFPWQKWLLIHALELMPIEIGDHPLRPRFRFRTVLVLVGRQNGKSTLTMILILWFMMVRCVDLVIGTAQSLGISEALWEEAVKVVQASPVLCDYIHKIHRANGGKRLRMDVGDGRISEYKVEAASRKGARGRSGDLVVLDELREHHDWEAYSAAANTTIATGGLVWCITNASDSSAVVLEHLRDIAHKQLGDPDGRFDEEEMADFRASDMTDSGLGFFEWSAPLGSDIHVSETWAYANPSMGYMIPPEVLRDKSYNDPEAEFITENLCQWVANAGTAPFPEGAWEACLDAQSFIDADSDLVFGVDVSPDRSHCSISVCGRRPDGDYHIELVAYMTRMSMIESWFRRRVDSYHGRMVVCVQGRGCPASALISSLSAIPGVEVIACQGSALTASCGALYDAIAASVDESGDKDSEVLIHHLAQPGLDIAAEVAQKRTLGDGAWAWDRKRSREDVSPLCAATWAFGYASGVFDADPVRGAGVKNQKPSSISAPGRTRAMLVV